MKNVKRFLLCERISSPVSFAGISRCRSTLLLINNTAKAVVRAFQELCGRREPYVALTLERVANNYSIKII